MRVYFVDFPGWYLRCLDGLPALVGRLFRIEVLKVHVAPYIDLVYGRGYGLSVTHIDHLDRVALLPALLVES